MIEWKIIPSFQIVQNRPNYEKNKTKKKDKAQNNIVKNFSSLYYKLISISNVDISDENQATMKTGYEHPETKPECDVVLATLEDLLKRMED